MTDMTDDEVLAADLALGLLDAGEVRTAEARVAADPAFARAVEWWRERVGTMGAAPVAPPLGLWRRIETRLAANDDAGPADARASLRWWRGATAATAGLAAVLLGVIALRPEPKPIIKTIEMGPGLRTPPLVASLSGERGTSVTVTYDVDARTMVVAPVVLGRGARDVELWVIPAGSTVPVSLGVIDAGQPRMRDVAPAQRGLLVEGATLAVSLEPRGGSPTGAPTGPVVATGKIVRV